MDLIICNTPFQAIQIENLIKKEIIKEFELFFFCYEETEQMLFYYNKLRSYSKCSKFYVCNKRFPLYFFDIKYIFGNKKYGNIYTASVECIYTHLILSYSSFGKLFTFDDGSANFINTSFYYVNKRSKFASIIYRVFGCKYDLFKTKGLINKHYTIYPNFENISNNIEVVDFCFSYHQIKKGDKESVDVLLGTVYKEITKQSDDLIKKIGNFFEDENFYYIPHPRDTEKYFKNGILIDGVEIAEIKILKLLEVYKKINVYGFNSTAQVNLSNLENVSNFCFKSELIERDFDVKYNYKDVEI
ncbi:glycosyltransferase family 52 [Photobacterium leiognathi]|uniref:glycosyltransferase family 52 n=1 Tax=Photobacterium leiognathi TaxID=553611 RepID=UPI002980A311|nr:glycosyltransferase family 52 [Photobacterium leiognathi]